MSTIDNIRKAIHIHIHGSHIYLNPHTMIVRLYGCLLGECMHVAGQSGTSSRSSIRLKTCTCKSALNLLSKTFCSYVYSQETRLLLINFELLSSPPFLLLFITILMHFSDTHIHIHRCFLMYI